MSSSFSISATGSTGTQQPKSAASTLLQGPQPTQNKPDEELRYLVQDYLPEAQFIAGGGFRFDAALRAMTTFIKQHVQHRELNAVVGVMPCLWSLDWNKQGARLSDGAYCSQLEQYATSNLPIGLCFDNPFIGDDILNDNYGIGLVHELAARNKHGKNFLVVANDKLRDLLKSQFPQLPIHCHANRVIAELKKRTPSYYNKLAEEYASVALHPADGGKNSLTMGLENKDKFVIIVNDPCLRTCPVRRDHLMALAQLRQEPYRMEHRASCAKLIERTACMDIKTLASGQSANLSHGQLIALYEQGFRKFAYQAQRHNSLLSLLTDILNTLFTPAPEHAHQVSTIHANFLQLFSNPRKECKSGMGDFAPFSNV